MIRCLLLLLIFAFILLPQLYADETFELELITVENANLLTALYSFQHTFIRDIKWLQDDLLISDTDGLWVYDDFDVPPTPISEEACYRIQIFSDDSHISCGGKIIDPISFEIVDTVDSKAIFSPDGTRFAIPDENIVKIYEYESGELLETISLLEINDCEFYCNLSLVGFLQENKKLLTASFYAEQSGVIDLELQQFQVQSDFSFATYLTEFGDYLITPNSQTGYTGYTGMQFISSISLSNVAEIHANEIFFEGRIGISPDSSLVAVGGSNIAPVNADEAWGIIYVFDMDLLLNEGVLTNEQVLTQLSGEHAYYATTTRFSPDGKLLVTTDSNGEVVIWGIPVQGE